MMLNSPEDLQSVEEVLDSDGFLGLVLVKDPDQEDPDSSDLYKTGTIARIIKKINLPDGGINVIITTLKRFTIKKYVQKQKPLVAIVTYPEEILEETIEVKALTRFLLTEMKAISENNPLFSEEMRLNMVNIDHPGKIADFVTGILNIDRKDQQKILETFDIKLRMEHVLVFIKKEQELLKIQKKIQSQINDKIEHSQREYFLKEQLRLIKQELGIAVDTKSEEYNRFVEAMKKLSLTGEVKDQVERELEKFSLMDPNGSEYHVTRNYLETIFSLPWKDADPVKIDLIKARRILDADHYGLEDVKERILEYLAVMSRSGSTRGSILCLVGPPGVGKTSIGKSIARALKKEFFRFSVGGMRDEAEIKGHRRTYVGAMPGKIIQGLKIVKSPNPVFMIDEIDKLGQSYQGDPSSALLEVLDPEQNSAFRDHYLDLPFDISRIMFITTANTIDSIPAPLLDRMEVIRLSGYIAQEKISIAKKYLIPKSAKKHGLAANEVVFEKSALLSIAEDYAREAGVRNYEKFLDKIHRKITKKLVEGNVSTPINIESSDLEAYLGMPLWRGDEQIDNKQAGIVTGLAWTNYGGDTLSIEAIAIPGKEGFTLTGQLGSVMQESAGIALSYVKSIAPSWGVSPDFFTQHGIHLHIPAGATPKDGPSAGITMASCLLSLITNKRIDTKTAMTGELSLAGRVLAIGGLKEKTIAARRAGIKDIIIPKANERDLTEIPDIIKKDIRFHACTSIDQVFALIFVKKGDK